MTIEKNPFSQSINQTFKQTNSEIISLKKNIAKNPSDTKTFLKDFEQCMVVHTKQIASRVKTGQQDFDQLLKDKILAALMIMRTDTRSKILQVAPPAFWEKMKKYEKVIRKTKRKVTKSEKPQSNKQ